MSSACLLPNGECPTTLSVCLAEALQTPRTSARSLRLHLAPTLVKIPRTMLESERTFPSCYPRIPGSSNIQQNTLNRRKLNGLCSNSNSCRGRPERQKGSFLPSGGFSRTDHGGGLCGCPPMPGGQMSPQNLGVRRKMKADGGREHTEATRLGREGGQL